MFPFGDCFRFVTDDGINQTKDAVGFRVRRLIARALLSCCVGLAERVFRRVLVSGEKRDAALAPLPWKKKRFVAAAIWGKSCHCTLCLFGVALIRRQNQPFRRYNRACPWIRRPHIFNRCTKRLQITVPCHLEIAAKKNRAYVIRSDRECAIKHRNSLRITAQVFVTDGNLLKNGKIARVQLESAFKIVGRFCPAALTPVHVTENQEWPWIIWQVVPYFPEFAAGAIVIAVTPVEMFCVSEM